MFKWLLLGLVFLSSCSVGHKLEMASLDSTYINFAKVKLKFDSRRLGSIKLRGYVFLVKDSLVYFKFYGPMSVEALSGLYGKDFVVTDLYHQVKYADVAKEVFLQTGIVFDRQVLESLLVCDLILLKTRLLQINDGYLHINSGGSNRKPFLRISNDKKRGFAKITVSRDGDMPSGVFLEYNDDLGNWSLSVEYVEISNTKRKLKLE